MRGKFFIFIHRFSQMLSIVTPEVHRSLSIFTTVASWKMPLNIAGRGWKTFVVLLFALFSMRIPVKRFNFIAREKLKNITKSSPKIMGAKKFTSIWSPHYSILKILRSWEEKILFIAFLPDFGRRITFCKVNFRLWTYSCVRTVARRANSLEGNSRIMMSELKKKKPM